MYVGGFPCGRKSSFWGLRRFLPLRSPLFSCAESREGRAIYFPPFLLSKHKSLIYETIPPFAEPCRAQAHGEGCHFRGILIVPAGQNRSRQALPCPLPGIPVPPANKTHRTEAGFLTFFHAVRPVPERACPPAHAFLFQSGTEALSPFSPFNSGNTFSTEGDAPKYARAMSVPSGSRNFNCRRNCAGSGAASLPVTPWATTSREASPSNSCCKAAATQKPMPPRPAPHTGLKTSSGCCPFPAYSARSNSGNVSVTVTPLCMKTG